MPSAASFDPLASPPPWCPECGYDLAGLPAEGRCPECGWGYDAEGVVLYGRLVADLDARARPTRTDRVAGAIVGVVLAGLLVWSAATSGSFIPLVFVLGLIAVAAAVMARNFRSRGNRPDQLRLTPEGFAKRRGFGPAELEPWGPDVDVSFRFDLAARHRLGVVEPADEAAAVVLRRAGGWYAHTIAVPVRAMFRFHADWPAVDELARRVIAWRDGADG